MYYPPTACDACARLQPAQPAARDHAEPRDLVLPLWCVRRERPRRHPGMPGCFLLSISNLLTETREAYAAGVRAVLLFDALAQGFSATAAYDSEGAVQLAVKAIKDELRTW